MQEPEHNRVRDNIIWLSIRPIGRDALLYPSVKDPWKTLDILPTRDLDKIKAAYRVHAQRIHPDKAVTLQERRRCTQRFVELREAYVHATFRAQYEADLQPLYIRLPPDPSENAFLSNDWFLAAVVLAAVLFGFGLIWMSAGYAVHYTAHTVHVLPMVQSIATFACVPLTASASRHVGAVPLQCRNTDAAVPCRPISTGGCRVPKPTVCQAKGFLLHCTSPLSGVHTQWRWRRSPRDDTL